MKGYFLIVGILIVIVSLLVTLSIFFQQSLQMEIAEQFNKQQQLISQTIANNVKTYFQFMKEESAEIARELSEGGLPDKKRFHKIVEEETRHRGVVKARIGLMKVDGLVLVLEGEGGGLGPIAAEISAAAGKVSGESGLVANGSDVAVFSPIRNRGRLEGIVFFSFALADIAERFVADVKSGTSGYAWIIDRKGNLLYHPTQHSMVGRNLYRADASCFKCHMSFELEKKIIEGKTSSYGRHIAPYGEDKITAFTAAEMDGLSWIVVMSAPYSEITRVTGQSMKLYSYLIISIFITTVLVSAVLIVFNKKRIQAMALAKRQEELEHYATELEIKVGERTAELKSEHEKLDTIVSAIGGGIVLIDRDGTIRWSNKAMLEMAGMDVTGLRCEDICSDCDISNTYSSEDTETAIISNLFGKTNKYFQITTAPVRSEDGELHGHIRMIQDVTELKKMEDQIIHSEKLASIGRLAAGIAHEIGNPMTSIFSFVQILREMEDDKFKKESLDTIYFHVNRVSDILKQLSGFSKMPAGEPKDCMINDVIEASLNLIQYDKKAGNMNIEKEFSSSLPLVSVDSNQLTQVFVNLILNAMDAMPDGGTLTVRSSSSDGVVRIQFADTGIGIGQDDQKKIFDPFFTTKEKGTGLGLSVSYNIIEKMSGSLIVDSRPGSGTVFTITLPVANNASLTNGGLRK